MKKLTSVFFGFFSRKPALFFVAAFWLITNLLMFPLLLKLRSLSGTMIPDVLPAHSAHALSAVFAAYGPEGMAVYAKVTLLDLFYPVSYALFFGVVVYILWRNSSLRHLAWIPVIAALIDYLENYYLAKIAADVSAIDEGLASITGNLVLAKMVLIGAVMLIIVAGLVRNFVSKKRA